MRFHCILQSGEEKEEEKERKRKRERERLLTDDKLRSRSGGVPGRVSSYQAQSVSARTEVTHINLKIVRTYVQHIAVISAKFYYYKSYRVKYAA